ncbi:transglutaminase TgpA family protein [Synechocystis salina]|uniref:transglutaminase TgpA family protein n=1 Tax=Synechocystis salina TaxID=945780 RepID=UPI002AD4577E|nr:transglutaminaseTgpA domain-containing protein [Synechocystis salina]
MVAMLFVFLGNLVENLNASQVALAGLLVQLQVLHSFDLPQRKDLGYSMVIGLILLGVAGTLSQTLAFAPWLLLFLAVAIPTLVLDYRSRLGLEGIPFSLWKSAGQRSSSHQAEYSPLVPRKLLALLAVTLAFGLLLFALMPRFPGYRLQSFPVSSPGEIQQQTFEGQNQDINNPGYRRGDGTGTGGEGDGSEPGQVDDTFYYGFNSRMNQNLRGQMTKQLVLRVRSQAPGFWKALSFDHYTGQGWEITDNTKITTVERSPWSYRFVLDNIDSLLETESVVQTYTAVMDLPNVIPSLYHPRFLYFPTREVGIDPNGSLRSPVGLMEGITYTVISEVPVRNRTMLQKYRIPPEVKIQPQLLQVPPDIKSAVRAKAEKLLAKSERPLETPYEISLYLTQALKQNYRVRTDLPFFADDEDLVTAFLFEYEGGLPDHFATVLTIMLRSLDIPARLTVGFAPGQFNPFTGYYLVHNTDAYALTEVFFPRLGWFMFDPIPGHELYPPSIENNETFSVLQQIWRWVAGWLPSPVSGFLANVWSAVTGFLVTVLRWFWNLVSTSLGGALLGLILAIAAGFLGWLGWTQAKRWLQYRRLAQLHPMARLYQTLLYDLEQRSFRKSRAQTPGEFAQSLREHLTPEQVEIIVEISMAYVAWRYGGQEPHLDYLGQQFKLLERSWRSKAKAKLL